MPCSQWILYLK